MRLNGKKRRVSQKNSRVFLFFFGLAFALAGGAFLSFFSLPAWSGYISARSWDQVPCNIVSAKVGRHDGDNSTSYSIDIKYRYEYQGKPYQSEKYDFMKGSSSGYDGKVRVVNQYLNMKEPFCYVDPSRPGRSVLNRDLNWSYLFTLFPLPFLAVGLYCIYISIFRPEKINAQTKRRRVTLSENRPQPTGLASEVVFRSGSGVGKFFAFLFFAAFWNGFLSFSFVSQVKDFHLSSVFDWFLAIFMIPFVLVGLGLIVLVIYLFLCMFNPRVELILNRGSVPLGGSVYLRWSFSGKVERIKRVEVWLVGTEQVTYQRGTDTSHDSKAFYKTEIYSSEEPGAIAAGEVGFIVPLESMHSFDSANNQIVWEVEIKGHINKWPDVDEKFKFTVLPGQEV